MYILLYRMLYRLLPNCCVDCCIGCCVALWISCTQAPLGYPWVSPRPPWVYAGFTTPHHGSLQSPLGSPCTPRDSPGSPWALRTPKNGYPQAPCLILRPYFAWAIPPRAARNRPTRPTHWPQAKEPAMHRAREVYPGNLYALSKSTCCTSAQGGFSREPIGLEPDCMICMGAVRFHLGTHTSPTNAHAAHGAVMFPLGTHRPPA